MRDNVSDNKIYGSESWLVVVFGQDDGGLYVGVIFALQAGVYVGKTVNE